MLSQYRSILRSAGLAGGGVLVGVVVMLVMMQYQGKLEVRFSKQETYIMLDGNQCSLIASPGDNKTDRSP
jgi:hypothetical protein